MEGLNKASAVSDDMLTVWDPVCTCPFLRWPGELLKWHCSFCSQVLEILNILVTYH